MMTGRLQDEPLPLILHQLHQNKATGVLKIETRVGPHEVYARAGFPVAVKLPGSAEQIGKVLVEMGIIDEDTHQRTLAAPPPAGMRYGEWLLDQRLVSPEHMKLALKAQVRRKLHRLFFLSEGKFTFQEGDHAQGIQREESLKIHPSRAIYQGVRSAWSAERLAGALFLLEGRAIKCLLDETAVARYGVSAEDMKIAELLRKGYWTLPDLVEAAGLPVQPVDALVYAFYVTDALDLKGADEVPRLRKRSESSVAQPLPATGTSKTPTPPRGEVPRAATPPKGEIPIPGRSSSRSDLPIPGRAATPPRGEVPIPGRAATPPRGEVPIPGRAPTPPRGTSSSNIPSPRMLTPGTPPRGSVPPALLTPGAPAPPSNEAMRREIENKARVVETEDLFTVLGLTRDANREQVKNAYFEAAKRYHPDRLTSLGLEALRPEVEQIFRRVSEAYGTLYDDARREDYKRTVGTGESSENPEAHAKAMKMLEAEMAFRRGEILLRKNDYVGAIQELGQAVAGNPAEGEHLAWLTWARVCASQLTWAEAKAPFLEAARLSPKCARALYFLGLAQKEEKDLDRALSSFRKAHELDPRLIDAERELRLIHMRKEKDKSSKGGLFDRFRKKS